MQYIGFDIQETHYGIASDNIIEILQDGVITPLPCAPQGVCGMTHYQGRSYPCLLYTSSAVGIFGLAHRYSCCRGI